jgi:hypothetical protein
MFDSITEHSAIHSPEAWVDCAMFRGIILTGCFPEEHVATKIRELDHL